MGKGEYLPAPPLATCGYTLLFVTRRELFPLKRGHHDEELCFQPTELTPIKNGDLWADIGATIGTDAFKTKAIDWLAGAVRVPTEAHDKMGPIGVDPRWGVFVPFHAYLLTTFPLVHSTLALTKVNTHGLWYEWAGSDASLKPLLLAAHQDVVPVDPTTVDQWEHPPYSGFFDGERIWGRGTSDDKGGLIGILSSIETLLAKGFKPSRTVVLAFGFDEETSGVHGAGHLGEVLAEHYGEGSFAMVVDEGAGFMENFGTIFATPGIAEKGGLDVRVDVTSAGGHSSIPPKHTSIGILAALLVEYESNPYQVHIDPHSPVFGTLSCYAEHAKELPPSLRKAIKQAPHSKKAMRSLEKVILADKMYKSLVGTTQAITLTQGGVKSNALPEQAWAVINHRIATESSVAATVKRDTQLLKSLSKKFNLTYTSFGVEISERDSPSSGTLTLSDAWGTALEPAPITPTGRGAAPYTLLAGTIKSTFNSHRSLRGDNIAMSPGIMTGNTDTRYYWKLSDHIFRYNHQNQGNGSDVLGGIHTVNEYLGVDAFLEMIRFFTTLILNADESVTL
ncbi:peptidase M20A family protein [Pleurotus pulmonarius]